MAWVYILKGAGGRHYIGSTTDLERRLVQHRSGHTHSTRRLGGDLELVVGVELASLAAAREFERELKRKKNPAVAIYLVSQRAASAGG